MKQKARLIVLISVWSYLSILPAIAFADNTVPSAESVFRMSLISVWSYLSILPAIAFADNTVPSAESVFRMSLAGGVAEETAIEERPGSTGDQTGTDPRDFSSKLMPYYRYTELENGVKVNELSLFGMYAFSPKFAMTFEWSVVKDMDYSSV
ncbi:MAG: hypothetical protein ACYTFX_10930, partial [Planctomycetota bacterium]